MFVRALSPQSYSTPSWCIEPKYSTRVLTGNWVEERRKVRRERRGVEGAEGGLAGRGRGRGSSLCPNPELQMAVHPSYKCGIRVSVLDLGDHVQVITLVPILSQKYHSCDIKEAMPLRTVPNSSAP